MLVYINFIGLAIGGLTLILININSILYRNDFLSVGTAIAFSIVNTIICYFSTLQEFNRYSEEKTIGIGWGALVLIVEGVVAVVIKSVFNIRLFLYFTGLFVGFWFLFTAFMQFYANYNKKGL